MRKLGEGTFSEVLKAESVKTKQKVAIKCMKSHFDNIEKVPIFADNCFIGLKLARNQSIIKIIPPQTYYPTH